MARLHAQEAACRAGWPSQAPARVAAQQAAALSDCGLEGCTKPGTAEGAVLAAPHPSTPKPTPSHPRPHCRAWSTATR
jgi:hypothetical protein